MLVKSSALDVSKPLTSRDVSEVQPANALYPMLSTVSGATTAVTLELSPFTSSPAATAVTLNLVLSP